MRLAEDLLWSGDLVRAAEAADEAVRVAPELVGAWQVKVRVACARGEKVRADNPIRAEGYARAAVRAARRCVELGPGDAENYRLLAVASVRIDRAGAVAAIDHAVRLAPAEADLHLVRSEILRVGSTPGTAAFVAADRAVREALRLDPDHRGARVELAHSEIRHGRTADGERLLREATAGDPEAAARIPEVVRSMDPKRRFWAVVGTIVLGVAVKDPLFELVASLL